MYLCGTPHSHFSYDSFRSFGGMRICMYLPMAKACSTSCFKEGRLSVEERIDLSLKPQQSLVLSLLLELASVHRVETAWGVDFHSLLCQARLKRSQHGQHQLLFPHSSRSLFRCRQSGWPSMISL